MNINSRLSTLCALGLSALAVGCDGGAATDGAGQSVNLQHGGAMPNLNLPGYQYGPSGTGINNNAGAAGTTDLTVDYNLALRTAAIKLRGDLPTMAEIRQLQTAVAANLSDGRRERSSGCLHQAGRRLHQRPGAVQGVQQSDGDVLPGVNTRSSLKSGGARRVIPGSSLLCWVPPCP